jgi:hypothetical protein
MIASQPHPFSLFQMNNETYILKNMLELWGITTLAYPFYSPKAARSRWVHSRKAILAFYRLAHRTVRCTTGHCPVQISFLIWRSRPLAHRTLSGAHRTVRCPLPTVGSATCLARIARPTVGPADRWLTGQSGAHRTVRWIIAVRR